MEGLLDADLGVAVGEVHNPAADDAFDHDDDSDPPTTRTRWSNA